FVCPIGFTQAAAAFGDPVAIAAGIGVGVSSSVVPYVFDQLAMARLARAAYALFLSLLPATAAANGIGLLPPLPSPTHPAGRARDGGRRAAPGARVSFGRRARIRSGDARPLPARGGDRGRRVGPRARAAARRAAAGEDEAAARRCERAAVRARRRQRQGHAAS